MRQTPVTVLLVLGAALWAGAVSNSALAQGYGRPLTMQGLDRHSNSSAASRGAGGISVGMAADPSVMFANPATLRNIEGIHLSFGALGQSGQQEQVQEWYPLRNFPTFSLMMEGLIDQIDDPDLTEVPEGGFGPEDSIARPYDDLKPNWSHQQPRSSSLQAFLAVPIDVAGWRVVLGAGATQYANLDYYYQNNNVLSPSIGTQRPVGIPLPAIGQELSAQWSQSLEQREGSIQGYGGAVSVSLIEELAVGVSLLILDGHTVDREATLSRGRIRFGNNNGVYYHSLDSVYLRAISEGTSDFSGSELSVSAVYRGGPLGLSIVAKPPNRITREFASTIEYDTTFIPSRSEVRGEDRMLFPWRGSLGVSFAVRQDLILGFEYELRPFASAEYTNSTGETSRPWLSSALFRVGAEFRPTEWLAIRAGFREQAEVFEEEGNALIGKPVHYYVYAAGLGISVAGVRLNAAYEYSLTKYQDMWQTNVNRNSEERHTLVADIAYVFR